MVDIPDSFQKSESASIRHDTERRCSTTGQ